MSVCELCNKIFVTSEGKYSSGRFCSKRCARSFSTKNKRAEINERVSKKLKGKKTYRSFLKRTKEQIELFKKNMNLPEVLKKKRLGLKRYNEERIKKRNDLPFEYLSKPSKRLRLIDEQEGKCSICKLSNWNNKPISLELDHINGDNLDNTKNNLRLLCPNCHSQTPTWRRRKSYGKGYKHNKEFMLQMIQSSKNMHECLSKLGLAQGSEGSIYKLMVRENIRFQI